MNDAALLSIKWYMLFKITGGPRKVLPSEEVSNNNLYIYIFQIFMDYHFFPFNLDFDISMTLAFIQT